MLSGEKPMFSLRSANSLLILTTAGCWRITSSAAVREEVCHDPATGPDRYLADIEQLPIVSLDPPPVPAFPDATLPGLWGFELILFCLLGIGAGIGAAYLLRRRGGVAFGRIDRRTIGVILLGLLAIGLLVIATENLLRGRAMDRYLQAAQSYWRENEHAQADARLLAARDLRQRSLMWRLTPFYSSALERIDVEGMRTVNGISAVHQAIERRDAAAAARVLTYLDADSAAAIEAGIAALSHRSRWLLVDGKPAGAVDSARRADGLRWAGEHTRSGVIRSNLCAAWYHLTVALVRGGEPAEAYQQVKLLDPPECDLDARHRAVVRGLVARSFATEYLDLTDPAAANTAGAVQMYEEAYQYGQRHEQDLPFLACDLVAALDAHAVASLARDAPAMAVDALDQSDAVIPGRPFVAATLPPALYALGNQHLTEENFEPAIEAMDRGYRLTEGKDSMLIEGLSRTYFALGGSQVEAAEVRPHVPAPLNLDKRQHGLLHRPWVGLRLARLRVL